MFADRVKETSTTTGTGTLDLGGAATGGFQTFVAGIGTGNRCYYCIQLTSASEWEVGIGTVTDAATDTLTRETVLGSSNAGALVNFSAGTKDVFCTNAANDVELSMVSYAPKRNIIIPAEQTVYVSGYYEVRDGFTIEVEAGGTLEVG
jgi:hypothetical protein